MKKVNLSVKDEKTLETAKITAISFESFIFLTSLCTLVVQIYQKVHFVQNLWPFACIIPFFVILGFLARKEKLYLNTHWFTVVLMLSMIWLPITIIFGMVEIAMSLLTMLELGVSYAIGYTSARHIRKTRLFKHKRIKLSLFINFWLLLLLGLLAFPVLMSGLVWYLYSVQLNMTHTLLLGFSVPFSMLLNYYMMFALYDEKGMAVIKDTMTHLVLVCLRNTMIVAMVMWVVFVAVFPPFS